MWFVLKVKSFEESLVLNEVAEKGFEILFDGKLWEETPFLIEAVEEGIEINVKDEHPLKA